MINRGTCTPDELVQNLTRPSRNALEARFDLANYRREARLGRRSCCKRPCFISGRGNITFTREQKQNLKQYIDQGVFIFAEACDGEGCDSATFDRQFRSLDARTFSKQRVAVCFLPTTPFGTPKKKRRSEVHAAALWDRCLLPDKASSTVRATLSVLLVAASTGPS